MDPKDHHLLPRSLQAVTRGELHQAREVPRGTSGGFSAGGLCGCDRLHRALADEIKRNYGTDHLTVHEYYEMKASAVELVDLDQLRAQEGEVSPSLQPWQALRRRTAGCRALDANPAHRRLLSCRAAVFRLTPARRGGPPRLPLPSRADSDYDVPAVLPRRLGPKARLRRQAAADTVRYRRVLISMCW